MSFDHDLSPEFIGALPELRVASGPPVVEVVASLGDSIVVVRHLVPPPPRKSRAPLVVTVGASALILVAVLAFGRGVIVAGRNEDARAAWSAAGRAAGDFREETLPPVWEGLGLSSLVLGLAGLAWAVRLRHDAARSSAFRVGTSRRADLTLAGVTPHELVRPTTGGWELVPAPGLAGAIERAGSSTPLAAGGAAIPLGRGDRVIATLGPCTLHLAVVDAPPPASMITGQPVDRSAFVFAGVSFVAHVGLLGLLYAIPPEAQVFLSRELMDELRPAHVDFRPLEERLLDELTPGKKGPEAMPSDPGGSQGGKGPEGKMGTPTSSRETGRFAMLRRADRPQLQRLDAVEAAHSAGVVGLFRSQPSLAFAALGGTGDFASGLDDRDVYGGLIGNEIADARGGWASGVNGTGPGGTGPGLDTIGLGPGGGPWGRLGHCDDGKVKCGLGPGSGAVGISGLHARSAKAPPPTLGPVSSVGELEASVIRRYVRQHLPQIQHCYERQLVVHPELQGTLDLAFVIAGTGDVLSVTARGLGNGDVEGCVAGVIGRIHFPAPAGSGLVRVTSYPLHFNAPG